MIRHSWAPALSISEGGRGSCQDTPGMGLARLLVLWELSWLPKPTGALPMGSL